VIPHKAISELLPESVEELKLVEDDSPMHIVPFSEGGDLHSENTEGQEYPDEGPTYNPGSPMPDDKVKKLNIETSFWEDNYPVDIESFNNQSSIYDNNSQEDD
jgi:hypothetical protein